MTEYNAFLDEWKAIRTTQETILRLLEGQGVENRKKLTRRTLLLSCGLLIAVLVVGVVLGALLSTHAQISSISYAVSTQEGCEANKGQWDIQHGQTYCFFTKGLARP